MSEDNIIRRTYAAELTPGDGRTVDVRIVPYGEQIEHNDGLGGVPKGVAYREEWVPGAFSHQERAANRVLANVEHEAGIRGVVGHGLALREGPDGLYGSFTIHETPAGDTALILVKNGVLDTVSLEAKPDKNEVRGGVVRRVKAHLFAIAFSRFGAYRGAQVLAVREEATFEQVDAVPPDLKPVERDPEVVERLVRLGLVVLPEDEAHPDESGTPSDMRAPL